MIAQVISSALRRTSSMSFADRVVKALGEREEIVMETILAGRLERSYGAAVERIDERYDLVASLTVLVEGILARELDRTLVGLRTRVGEEYLAVQMGLFDELLRDLHHGSCGETGWRRA